MRVSEIIRQVLDVIDQAEAQQVEQPVEELGYTCLLYTSPSPRDRQKSRMPSSA